MCEPCVIPEGIAEASGYWGAERLTGIDICTSQASVQALLQQCQPLAEPPFHHTMHTTVPTSSAGWSWVASSRCRGSRGMIRGWGAPSGGVTAPTYLENYSVRCVSFCVFASSAKCSSFRHPLSDLMAWGCRTDPSGGSRIRVLLGVWQGSCRHACLHAVTYGRSA